MEKKKLVPPSNSLNAITARGNITRSRARDIKERRKNNGASEEKEHDTGCSTFGYEEEKEWMEDIAHMLRWEAKCLGYSYLGEDNLQQHNITMLQYDPLRHSLDNHPAVDNSSLCISHLVMCCKVKLKLSVVRIIVWTFRVPTYFL
jgi:hypothetical protein